MSLSTDFALEYTLVEGDSPVVTAIIVAAGNGTRMGCNKQLVSLMGIPVLARTLLSFENCKLIRDIVVVTKKDMIADVQNIVDTYNILKLKAIVEGGCERQDSVAKGLSAVSDDTIYVAIHDGARPLISTNDIEKVISFAGEKGAAALGVPVKDTIKRVGHNKQIIETPLRASLYAIQTPQVFNLSLFKKALEEVKELGISFTDDCQVLEALGYPVYVVEGDYKNIKITTPDDLLLAELLLQQEKKND